jgi:hypothetical protein
MKHPLQGFFRRSESEIVAHGLRYQALASQVGSEVVQGEIAIRIFFKSLQLESVQIWPECNLVKPWQEESKGNK